MKRDTWIILGAVAGVAALAYFNARKPVLGDKSPDKASANDVKAKTFPLKKYGPYSSRRALFGMYNVKTPAS